MPSVVVEGIAGRRAEACAAVGAEFDIPWRTDSAVGLVESDRVDAVILALPPILQPELAVRAFEGGKHVLCEKPLAVAPAQARAVVNARKRAKRVGMVNFCYRLVPQVEQFAKLLAAGKCGTVQSIEAQWILPNRLDTTRTFHWKGQREHGGGVLQNLGVHMLDYLFHDSSPLSPAPSRRRLGIRVLGAAQSVLYRTRPDEKGRSRRITGDETTTALLETEGGTTVMLHLSLVTRPGLGHRVVAWGNKGTLELRNLQPDTPAGPFSLWFWRDNARHGICLSAGDKGERHDFAALFSRTDRRFVNAAISGKTDVGPSLEDGLKTVELARQIQEAAAKP